MFTAHLPGGTSNRNIKHYFQKIKNGTKYYDHGIAGNLRAYGSVGFFGSVTNFVFQPYPREYDFSGFTIPTSVFYSPADKLVSTEDIKVCCKSIVTIIFVNLRSVLLACPHPLSFEREILPGLDISSLFGAIEQKMKFTMKSLM